jgi:glutaconate CoA-transferase subunit A
MSPATKISTMQEAISRYVEDGNTIAIEGFTAFICFAAAHEIIRQGKQDLTLCRLTPDLIYDQMIAAGIVRKLIFSYLGNPGVGNLHCIRRAVEKGIPRPLALEEYSHFGMVGRYLAGASNLPFFPLRSYAGSDLPQANPHIKYVDSPYGDGPIAVVPPLKPDVAFVHAQRADAQGNTHLWGLVGVQKEVAFAARRLVVVVEEIVDEAVIRRDPNRTLIPGLIVDAVVCEPYGAHPSYVQGYYDRDNPFYLAWDTVSREQATTEAWLQEWVYGVPDRAAYRQKLGQERLASLAPGEFMAEPVNYGRYGNKPDRF